ncbi:MAG: hypothetical protein IKA76_07215 [Clostridia bacterium]|nr:hypothetical protein [Clostridia bacterium]
MDTKQGRLCRMIPIFLSLLLLLGSCGQNKQSPDEILEVLTQAVGELPRGVIYRSRAEEGEESYPPSAVLRAMYGESAEDLIRQCDFAIYLSSFAKPYEIAVLTAPSADHARKIHALCLSRADDLRVALTETDFVSLADEIRIYRSGRTVIMGMTPNSDAFYSAVRRLD